MSDFVQRTTMRYTFCYVRGILSDLSPRVLATFEAKSALAEGTCANLGRTKDVGRGFKRLKTPLFLGAHELDVRVISACSQKQQPVGYASFR